MDTVKEAPKKVLTASDILAGAEDVDYAEVPGFKPGEVFRIRSVTAGDMIEWTDANNGEAKKTAGLRLIVKSLVDANGKPLFDNSAIATLRKLKHKTTETIIEGILKLNGMTVKKDKKTTTGEDDAKND